MAGYAFAKRAFPGPRGAVLAGAQHAHRARPGDADPGLLPAQGPEPAGHLPGRDPAWLRRRLRRLPDAAVHPDPARPSWRAPGRVDGASEWQIYRHIILPLCTPALAVLAIFTFQRYWNGFILPLVVLRDSFKYPIQVGLATLQGEFNTDYGMLMTGAAVAAIPMMLVFFAFQRYFVEGIRIGGVKG